MIKRERFVIKDGVLAEYYDYGDVEHMIVPEGVTHLAPNVFNMCNFNSVTLPQSLQAIGAHAFGCCMFLEKIDIPEGVTVINSKAFYLSGIRKVTCGSNLTKVGSNALTATHWFNEQPGDAVVLGNALLSVRTDAETYRVPDTVTLIADSAFEKCKNLRIITVPENVKIIGDKAFTDLPKLEQVIVEGTPEFAGNCLPASAVLWAEKLSVDAIKTKILKHQAVLGFFLCGKSDDVPKPISKYLAKNFEKMLPDIEVRPGLLEALAEHNIMTIQQTDLLLEKAVGNTERTALLLDYKNRAFSAEEREIEVDTQLEKQLKGPTATELKKQWTVVAQKDGTVGLSYYKGLDLDVCVPAMVGKKQVTKILKECFLARETPTSVQQDEIMRSITRIHIPEGIVSIGSFAFSSCRKLEAIFIPASVKSISAYAGLDYGATTIYAPAGSYAEAYAKQHNIPFVAE